MSIDSSAPRSRRAILGAALGGLGAIVASRLANPDKVSADPGDPVLVDAAHTGTGTTAITSTVAGAAILGSNDNGIAVSGRNQSVTPSDFVTPSHRTALYGVVGNDTSAPNTDESAVYGYANVSEYSSGVWGDSDDGNGVVGTGTTGVFGIGWWGVYAYGRSAVTGDADVGETGVHGFSGPTAAPLPVAGVGVQATAGTTAQIALNVVGKAKFSRSGRTYVGTNTYLRRVNMAGVTTSSYILATLQTRRTGVYVHAVVPAAGYFVIYLNKSVTANTYVGYLVIN
jgi:hypothetical protein